MTEIGVKIKKKIEPKTIGFIILPNNIPNLYHNKFKECRALALKTVTKKIIIAKIKIERAKKYLLT
jgi:hypothetical protein